MGRVVLLFARKVDLYKYRILTTLEVHIDLLRYRAAVNDDRI